MIRNKLIALTGSAIAAGVAGVALSAPATAMEAKDPQAGLDLRSPATSTTSGDDSQWLEIGLGALGGLAIAGAGVAAATGLKRRGTVPTS
ncbi:MAG: hypothetical protein ACTHKG_07770 [Nocardioides sp.]